VQPPIADEELLLIGLVTVRLDTEEELPRRGGFISGGGRTLEVEDDEEDGSELELELDGSGAGASSSLGGKYFALAARTSALIKALCEAVSDGDEEKSDLMMIERLVAVAACAMVTNNIGTMTDATMIEDRIFIERRRKY
jgi:hypothetical protein